MNREALMAAMDADTDDKPVPVDIKGWGRIFIRILSADEVDEIRTEPDDTGAPIRSTAKSVARIICDEAGSRIFDHKSEDDLHFLGSKGAHKLIRVLEKHRQLVEESAEGN